MNIKFNRKFIWIGLVVVVFATPFIVRKDPKQMCALWSGQQLTSEQAAGFLGLSNDLVNESSIAMKVGRFCDYYK